MIMWPLVVVPASNVVQSCREFHAVRDRLHRQCPLHRSNEPFNSSILPRTPRLTALMTDAECPEAEPEEAGDEHRFIVCPEERGSTVLFDRLHEFLHKPERGLVRERLLHCVNKPFDLARAQPIDRHQ